MMSNYFGETSILARVGDGLMTVSGQRVIAIAVVPHLLLSVITHDSWTV